VAGKIEVPGCVALRHLRVVARSDAQVTKVHRFLTKQLTIRISCRGRLQDLYAARNQYGGTGQLHPLVLRRPHFRNILLARGRINFSGRHHPKNQLIVDRHFFF
jgi:hypothetical protein